VTFIIDTIFKRFYKKILLYTEHKFLLKFSQICPIYRIDQISFIQQSVSIRYRNKLRFDSCHLNLQP